MADIKALKLGEILLEDGLITHDQLLESLRIQEKNERKLGEILIERGYATDQQIAKVLARIYDLPFVNLAEVVIEDKVFSVLPFKVVSRHGILPIELKDKCLVIATNNPLDVSAFQEIQYMTGFQVRPVIAGQLDIVKHLEKYGESMKASTVLRESQDSSQSASITKMVESIIIKAIKERASDIHLEPHKEKMRLRYRIDGMLYEKPSVPLDLARKVISRIKIVSGMDVAENRRPQDGRMSLPEEFKHYDIRVSTLPNINGETVVLRILDKSFTNFSLDSLGMSHNEIAEIKKLIDRPYGMVLVTGPTGAGKTTTLYSFLNLLNETSKNVITIEDPVEYVLEGVNQTAINNQAGYTFATAIRHILRHDPNVIMVGEIRDMETAEIAIRAAMTGHLVLSTLHTNTAPGAVMRLLDMRIEPFLIRSAVIAVIAQRLIRRLCPYCKKDYQPSPELLQSVAAYLPKDKPATFAQSVGCDKCFKTGFAGRVAIYEVLVLNEPIRNLILKSPNENDITALAVEQGMKILRQAGVEKALQKVTSLEEVMRATFAEKD